MKRLLIIGVGLLSLLACGPGKNEGKVKGDSSWLKDSLQMDSLYNISKFHSEPQILLDSVLPFFAKLHDSIPKERRFDTLYKSYMDIHKTEKKYEWMYYYPSSDSFTYFMISRLEPSMKSDKFSSMCARFKRSGNGSVDTSTYEELFWTWKMRKSELNLKSAELFKAAIQKKDLSVYLPEKTGDDEWIMFPDGKAYFDKVSKTWKVKDAIQMNR